MSSENSAYSIAGKFLGASAIVAGFDRIHQAATNTTNRIIANNQKAARSWQHQSHAMSGYISGLHKVDRFMHGYQMLSVGSIFRSQVQSMRPFVDEALKLSQAQMKFRAINLPELENQRAFAAVAETVKNVRGLKLTEVTETLTDMHTATGSLSHALEGLAIASKFRFGFETMMGDKFSPEQIEQSIQRAFKFLEITGVMQQGQKAVEERFNAMVQMMTATGGRVTPDMMLLMAQRGGSALRSLSLTGMRNMSAPLQELGAARAGTALRSLYATLVGGKISSKPGEAEFIRLGLLPKSAIVPKQMGTPRHVAPGGFGKFRDAMLEDPLKAADMLVRAMAKPLKGKPVAGAQLLVDAISTGVTIPAGKLGEVRTMITTLFGNRMAEGLMDIFATQRPQVMKEFGLSAAAKNIQQVYDQALGSPAGKILEFQHAVENLEAVLGAPLLDVVTRAATGLMPLMKLMSRHPDISLTVLAFLKLASVLGQVAIAARMSGLTSLFGAGAGAAGGGIAAAGAGAASGAAAARTGGILATGIVGGMAAIVVAAMAVIIANALDAKENEENAAEAGKRIGEMLRLRFEDQIAGKLSPIVQAEVDKATAPALAKNIIQEQGLDTGPQHWYEAWKAKSTFLMQLAEAAGVRKSYPGDIKAIKKHEDPLIAKMYMSGIMSAPQLEAYLTQARETLKKSGRGDLYPELERLAGQAFPGLIDKIFQQVPLLDSFSQAIRRASGQLNMFNVSPQPGFPGMPGRAWPSFTPGLPGAKKGEFNFGAGGFIRPSSLPLPLERLPDLMRVAQASGSGPIEVHVHQSITGEVSEAMLQRIREEARKGVLESSHEIRSVLDKRTRDREMMA